MGHLTFQLEAEAPGTRARAGVLETAHGTVRTPVFMPVGTRATVRGQTVETLERAGARILLANTLHLLQRPGLDVFDRFGGIHRLMGWPGPVLTDSGGFQIFSLGSENTEEGASFRDPISGRTVLLTPESSLDAQRRIGSDIAMVLDECVAATADRATAAAAVARTLRWARRSLEARGDAPQALFGIVQGAIYPELRAQSAAGLIELPFDGFAIGGLAVGEGKSEREDMTERTTELLPADKPRYLMGVGTPLDLLEAVHRGVDMFDCILPTAHAQRGLAYTRMGRLDLRRGAYRLSEEPLDASCACPVCARHPRAYLHHLVKAGEVLAWQLVGEHNLHHWLSLMARMRAEIVAGTFRAFYDAERERLAERDPDAPVTPPKPKRRKAPPPLVLGDYEIVVADAPGGPEPVPRGPGLPARGSVRQRSSGETMHSFVDPIGEAEALYVAQSGLRELLSIEGPELVLWDVGLGAATNAMAALAAAADGPRELRIVSFEQDLDPLRLALLHPDRFAHLRHRAPHAILREGRWEAPGVRWELLRGDFAVTLDEAPAPDLVFYDPFSYKADVPLWTPSFFARLRGRCERSALYTYSTSTAVRGALLSAGFFVGRGAPTGPKTETTAAYTHAEDARVPLLGPEWLRKWEKSSARLPAEVAADPAAYEARIREHLQWR
jgi:queuine tRNA-ribosyltransferase